LKEERESMSKARISSALALSLVTFGAAACTSSVDTPNGGGPSGTTGGSAAGGSAAGGSGGASGSSPSGGVGATTQNCTAPVAPKAPLRRLTRFEYNNTVRDLAKNMDSPADLFPPDELGSGFGADAKTQTVSDVLAEKYMTTAKKMAAALTAADRIAELAPCATAPAKDAEVACVRTAIDKFVPLAFRRPLEAGEADGLVQLFQTVRTAGATFPSSLAAVVEAVFQAPEFLYRPEIGVPVEGRADLLRPTGYEMATRLSYLFLGSLPDDGLRAAAASGALSTAEGVKTEAERLLTDARARSTVRFFFDNLLPIQGLSTLTRGDFPEFTGKLGSLMRQETQTFLEHEVFDGGTWPQALTAPYTYVNEQLAAFYGITGVTGEAFQKVSLDGVKRAGLLTQAGMVAGPIHSNETNPVVRGAFVLNRLMCVKVSLPPASLGPIVPPDAKAGGTARDRFTAHSSNPQCAGCHKMLDPIGFALENFNAIGQWQDQENGQAINVTVDSPQLGTFSGAVELGKKLAEYPDAQVCFASNWANYAYGRGTEDQDACTLQQLQERFTATNYNIKELLVQLAQTDTFLYLPAVRE
jgi:hypothetical protein